MSSYFPAIRTGRRSRCRSRPLKWCACSICTARRWQAGITNGRARLYVNRGLGVTGKPFRYHCPAEISVFRLLRA